MVKLKSEKILGVIITFKKLRAEPRGSFVNAYYKNMLVGTGETKQKAIKSISKKVIIRIK